MFELAPLLAHVSLLPHFLVAMLINCAILAVYTGAIFATARVLTALFGGPFG